MNMRPWFSIRIIENHVRHRIVSQDAIDISLWDTRKIKIMDLVRTGSGQGIPIVPICNSISRSTGDFFLINPYAGIYDNK